MLDGIGQQFPKPVTGLPTGLPPVAPAAPQPSAAPAAPVAPSYRADVFTSGAHRLNVPFDLPPLPFEQTAPAPVTQRVGRTPQAPPHAAWQHTVQTTQQAGLGGLLDRVGREFARHDPSGELPLSFPPNAPGYRPPPGETLNVARQLEQQGFPESPKLMAFLAGETATGRPERIAALKLAHRLEGRTEAEHILFRSAQKATTPDEALATARRAVQMGYPENAKFAYHRAAKLAPDAQAALVTAKEASAAGLKFEADEPAMERWRERLDSQFKQMEDPAFGPAFEASASPYQRATLPRARYINPYLSAMVKATPAELPRIAWSATVAGEHATAALIRERFKPQA